jgi:hypothetical protein
MATLEQPEIMTTTRWICSERCSAERAGQKTGLLDGFEILTFPQQTHTDCAHLRVQQVRVRSHDPRGGLLETTHASPMFLSEEGANIGIISYLVLHS